MFSIVYEFISTLELELNEKTQIIPLKKGIKFCGFHIYITKDGKVIQKLLGDKKRKAKKKYRKLAIKVIKEVEFKIIETLVQLLQQQKQEFVELNQKKGFLNKQ